ncbi:MAG: TIGR03086 family metal-binding protein [Egibacteraceae bacterium]
MSEVSQRYARLAESMTTKIASVPDDRWANPSPCEKWTARDVVRHVIEAHGRFLGLVGRELGAIPAIEEDPLAAWNAARKIVQADLDDPERASAEFDGFAGRTTFEQAIDQFICGDLLIHSWDLARATGLYERLDPDEVRRVAGWADTFGDLLRGPGACGPALEPPPGADDQTKLLAFLGRRSWH